MPTAAEVRDVESSPRLQPVAPRGRTVSAWRRYAIGMDYGTHACRAVLVDTHDGEEVAETLYEYAGGTEGVHRDPNDPRMARHDPHQYGRAFVLTLRRLVHDTGVEPHQVIGIGIAAIGSVPIPTDAEGVPLATVTEFEGRPDAMAPLPEDRTSEAEAREIAELALRRGEPYRTRGGAIDPTGGFWSPILRCARTNPELFAAARGWIELADLIPAMVTGNLATPARGLTVAHRAMFSPEWGGWPSCEFLAELDSGLAELRDRLDAAAAPSDGLAGFLTEGYARSIGLARGVPVAVGSLREAAGAVGAGIRMGTLVRSMEGSVAAVATSRPPASAGLPPPRDFVLGAVSPGTLGFEIGASSVERLCEWSEGNLAPTGFDSLWRTLARTAARLAALETCEGEAGTDDLELLNRIAMRARRHDDGTRNDPAAGALWPDESGLLALDWNDGDGGTLADSHLSGLLIGQTLATTAPEILRALIEATAFGTKRIVERIEAQGVPVREVVLAGEIVHRSPMILAIYADVLGRPVRAARSRNTAALGAAVFGALVGGAQRDLASAQRKMVGASREVHRPDRQRAAVYRRLDGLSLELHGAFGTREGETDLGNVMKDLLMIRDEVRLRRRTGS